MSGEASGYTGCQLWNEVKLGMIPLTRAAAGLGQVKVCSSVSQSAHHFLVILFPLFYSNNDHFFTVILWLDHLARFYTFQSLASNRGQCWTVLCEMHLWLFSSSELFFTDPSICKCLDLISTMFLFIVFGHHFCKKIIIVFAGVIFSRHSLVLKFTQVSKMFITL